MNWSEERAKADFEDNFNYLKSLRDRPELDQKVQQLHDEVFDEVDCLACANCCKTTPPIVLKSDVKRIAKFLNMPPKTFIKKHLIEDVNRELIMNYVPCTFLQDDHKCSIYEVRPRACRNYPHTDEANFGRRAKLNAHNTIVCPATYEIVKRLREV